MKHSAILFLLILSLSVLPGCAIIQLTTADEVRNSVNDRNKAFKSEQITVDRKYSDVLKTLTKLENKCLPIKVSTVSNGTVLSENYYIPELHKKKGRAELHYRYKRILSEEDFKKEPVKGIFIMLIDAERKGKKSTNITMYWYPQFFGDLYHSVRQMLVGEHNICPSQEIFH